MRSLTELVIKIRTMLRGYVVGRKPSEKVAVVGTTRSDDQMSKEIKLSDNFWLYEFEKSDTAVRLGIDNTVPEHLIPKLEYLAATVLQPTRDHFVKRLKRARSMKINSGYRCPALNFAVGSKDTSQHLKAEAADAEIPGVDNYEVACWIRDNLEFDQLILEFYTGEPSSGWVHVSKKEEGHNRNECLTINTSGVKRGLHKEV